MCNCFRQLPLPDLWRDQTDPALGTFLSPDTVVADAGTVIDYNRFMYARGNPLRYADPSGHIAICFLGGYQNGAPIEQDNPLYQLCSNGLREGGYDPARDGDILVFRNDEGDIGTALEAILAAQESNPYEPVILLGHSWGGAAAMKLAYYLNCVPDPGAGNATGGPRFRSVQVDLMILLEAENDLRTLGFLFGSLNAPDNLTDNVRMAVNIYAEDWEGPWGRDFPGNLQNGMNYLKGALNIGLNESRFADGSTAQANHWNLVHLDGSLNLVTKGLIADQVSLYLTGYDGQ
jgi:pimeloyl-ACP methyl ester carboxylesterase